MALLGTIAAGVGIAKKAGGILGGINKGTCGKKCYGFGKSLRKCRDRRDADCKRAEREKKEQQAAARLEEQRILNQKNARQYQAPPAMAAAASGFRLSPGTGLAIGGGLLAFIFLMFNFMQK